MTNPTESVPEGRKKKQVLRSNNASGLMTPTSPHYPPYGYMETQIPQFSVQYYSDFSNGYQSYPGSPALHPQSPSAHPQSPPFSPTYAYQSTLTLSPPTHAYAVPHQHFPPLHISSPLLTGVASPGSPQYISLPGPFGVDRSIKSMAEQMESNQFHPQNVYVRGLAPTTTDESFLELCGAYGEITSSKAILDQKTGECKGYGFTMYANDEDCTKAIEGLNKAGLQASFARVGQESFSSKLRSLQDETSTNIYISNLPLDTTEQKLEELFQPLQTISNRILRDPQSGMSRGVGFARMADRHAASAIIERFNGQSIVGSSAPLQVRFADSAAQKKLKSQTSRKRMIRPRDFHTMAGFPVRPMMPITPETMLGIAPSMSNQPFYPESLQYAQYSRPIVTCQPTQQTSDEILAETVEKQLTIKESLLTNPTD
ncbi:hypothetical protein CLU79DRAFT_509761 [Phycomyces nitens]|nr:hypothetical protein CLU79DRAFT_509761 [Phycomyces nitens]